MILKDHDGLRLRGIIVVIMRVQEGLRLRGIIVMILEGKKGLRLIVWRLRGIIGVL